MTTDSEIYKHGFNGLLKMQKEMWRIDYQSEVGTIIPQLSTFKFYTFSFIHEYSPRFPFQTSPEIILGSSDEGGSFTHRWTNFEMHTFQRISKTRATIIAIIDSSNSYQWMVQLACVHIFSQLRLE